MGRTNDVDPGAFDAEDLPVRRFHSAYELVRAEIEAVDGARLLPVTLDVPRVVTSLLGRLPELERLRERVAALGDFDMAPYDAIGTYALALGHTHLLYVAASEPTPIPDLVAELGPLRLQLMSDARALLLRGELVAPRGALRGRSGFNNLAFDVLRVCTLLRERWSFLDGRTGLRLDTLDRAEALGTQLLTALGAREQRHKQVAAATVSRQRAFTLFVKAYSQVRRAISYLFWELPEAERIAPSLYLGRSPKRRAKPASDVRDASERNSPPDAPLASSDLGAGERTDVDEPPPGLPGHAPFPR